MTRPAVRVLTPPGTGAIATVEVRGPDAWATVRNRFTPASGKALPESPPQHRLYFGTLGDGSHADEVVVAVKAIDVVEVHCHGGRRVVQWISQLLGESTLHQPKQGSPWGFLPHAPTLRTASILLDQYNGAFGRAIDDILSSLDSAGPKLDTLAHYTPVGRHLTTPWRVVVAGEPNVGKSSLVNALAGFQRSVVSATAGTTRDVVTTLTAIDGWPVELADTAGLRSTMDEIEAEGVGRAATARTTADLVVWVLDGSTPITRPPESDFVVINKTDLPPGWDWQTFPSAHHGSAATGAGLPEILAAVSARLVPDPPPPGAAVPFSHALADTVMAARAAYSAGNLDTVRAHFDTCRSDLSGRTERSGSRARDD